MSTKLTTEEIAEINQLELDYTHIKLSIGDIATRIAELDEKMAELESEKFDHLQTYRTISERDKQLNAKLSQKYGRGTINVTTGEISEG